MPQVSQVHIDAALTDVSVQYGANEYVSNRLFPIVPVAKESDKYYIIDAVREGLRQSDDRRAPGAKAHEVDFATTNDSYFCDDHAQQAVVPDEERANADPALQADIDKTEYLTNKIMLNKEIALAAALATAVTQTAAAAVGWNDYANSPDPITDVNTGITTIRAAVQVRPNTLVMDYAVFLALCDHPDIVDRIKYTSGPNTPAVVIESAMAKVFKVDQILVADCFKNTAVKGQTAAVSAVWSDTVYLAYVPPRPGLRMMALGSTFAWSNAALGQANEGRIVEQWRDDERKGDMTRVSFYYDQKVVAAAAAYKITNCIQ